MSTNTVDRVKTHNTAEMSKRAVTFFTRHKSHTVQKVIKSQEYDLNVNRSFTYTTYNLQVRRYIETI